MRTIDHMNVLFVAAAGPRQGFGHLVRCGVLASGLGARPRVALRGSASARRQARALGWQVHMAMPTLLRTMAPDLLVVDEPSVAVATRWVRAARERGIAVAAISDLRLNAVDADLTIDGSITTMAGSTAADLQGPEFAILDATIARLRHMPRARDRRRVLIALGGGTHVRRLGRSLAHRIQEHLPDIYVDLAPGFSTAPLPTLPSGCQWISPYGLRQALATTGVAIVAGGTTVYEAAALGAPIVTLAVADAQRTTTRAFSDRGGALDASEANPLDAIDRAAMEVAHLIVNPDMATLLSQQAARLVDGNGTARVIDRLRALVALGRGSEASHAA